MFHYFERAIIEVNKTNFFQLLYLESGLLSVAQLTVVNLVRLGISVRCQVSVRPQYLVGFFSLGWITDRHTTHPPIEGLLPSTGIEPTLFRNQASKVAGLQVHTNTPGFFGSWESDFQKIIVYICQCMLMDIN